jgi:GT2 family glycosyltransferase
MAHLDRPVVSGKFLQVNEKRFLVKGVSYGTFAPDADGALFPELPRIAQDFDAIATLEANTVRTYTPPPGALLDEASRCGLRTIIGVPWMQHVAFLDRRVDAREIRRSVRDQVRRLATHPAALLFALGNEIPPPVVRWYGRKRIERFLRDLYDDAKSAAPDALLTYINYPPTEYLDTPFFDVCAFNVFLHSEAELSAYLARLHHIAGPRPLLISELGADSLRNGEEGQSRLVRVQVQTALREGACGAVVFTWTDDWWRGGRAVDDWAFGLVDTDRRPKPAYKTVQGVFAAPVQAGAPTPRVSVVVCAYNAVATIDECLDALERVNYPDFEVIVVNDGSTDGTAAAAARHRSARVIDTPNAGLSAARNVGLHNATGEIVAYTDADVRVDPDWLTYLVQPFATPEIAAAGGPAVVPPDDPWFAHCVARAPGGPTHVLLEDRIAEHVPGCNCAFRRGALLAIGGFNPVFRRAGDDVDVCWRIQAQGWNVGFAPAALVWHRHRVTTRAYCRQQVGYGEGETWLMDEHPDKFIGGRIDWRGHIYSPLPFLRSLQSKRINAGPFGTAGFPSIYRTDAHPFSYLPHSGRWQVAWVALLATAGGAAVVHPSLAPPLLALAAAALLVTLVKCALYSRRSDLSRLPSIALRSRATSVLAYRLAIAWLHFVQPFARLWGRGRGVINRPKTHRRAARIHSALTGGLGAAQIGHALRLFLSLPVETSYWSQRWVDVADFLGSAAHRLRQQRAVRLIELDSGWWENRDLTIINYTWFRLNVRALVEDHGGGHCLHRVAVWSRPTAAAAPYLVAAAGAVLALRYTGLSWVASTTIVGTLTLAGAVASILATCGVVLKTLGAVAESCGMTAIPSPRGAEWRGRRATHVPVQPAGLALTSRALTDEPDNSRAMIGDL